MSRGNAEKFAEPFTVAAGTIRLFAAADQQLKLRFAIAALVLVDRHVRFLEAGQTIIFTALWIENKFTSIESKVAWSINLRSSVVFPD